MDMNTFECDVAVIGLGPVGAITANLLAHQGLRVVALDREPDVMQVPRGVGIDGEIMRVMQTLGLAASLEPFLKVFRGAQYIDSAGSVVASRPAASSVGSQGWPDRYNVHQPEFEEVLRTALRSNPLITELVSTEVENIIQSPEAAQVLARSTKDGSALTVTAKYVVGADGGRSTARRIIGSTYEDYGLNQPWIVADFKVSDAADLPAINTHYAHPVSPAIYIHVVRDIRRFEFRAAPGEDLEAAVMPDRIWSRVAPWLAPEDAELLRAAVYTHRSLVVDTWRHGRVLLAGDAAHQTPPFLGQGLCTGVRDAAALAWRLRDVLLRGAPEDLLDSYGKERAAHARHFITTATELGTKLTQPTKESIELLNSRVGREGRGVPPRLGDGIYDAAFGGGYLSAQPRNGSGVLVDDLIGYEFGLIITPEAFSELSEEVRSSLPALRVIPLVADAALHAWLHEQQAQAVLVRPDRYVYGSYAEVDDLLAGLDSLAAARGQKERAVSG